MKVTDEKVGGIPQLSGALSFTEKSLIQRVDEYLDTAPEHLYHGDIVKNDKRTVTRPNGYYAESLERENPSFCEVIAMRVLEKGLNIAPDEQCIYSRGERAKIVEGKAFREMKHDMAKMEKYCAVKDEEQKEERMVHCFFNEGEIDGYTVLDYQVPTTNGGSDKIDLVMRKDGVVYITEVKRFGSDESFLRCALEILTYRKKLNGRFFEAYDCTEKTLKLAVLIDGSSFAFKQLSQPWAQKLKAEITVLELSKDSAFHIQECK